VKVKNGGAGNNWPGKKNFWYHGNSGETYLCSFSHHCFLFLPTLTMAVLSPPTLSPLLLNTNSDFASPPSFPLLPFSSSTPTIRFSSQIFVSYSSKFVLATSPTCKLFNFHVLRSLESPLSSIFCRIRKWVGHWAEKNLAWALWLRCWCWWVLFSLVF